MGPGSIWKVDSANILEDQDIKAIKPGLETIYYILKSILDQQVSYFRGDSLKERT